MKHDSSANISEEYEGFEHVIRYEDGIKSDFVLASWSVPINYDYSRNSVHFFWDGGLLANTPLRQTYIAHRYYWPLMRNDPVPSFS